MLWTFLNKPEVSNFVKRETLTQVFSCEFYEFFLLKEANFLELLKSKQSFTSYWNTKRTKDKFVNKCSTRKWPHLYCKLVSFEFSISPYHLDLAFCSDIHQFGFFCLFFYLFIFWTWRQVRNLSFSAQAGVNYRLHYYFELIYIEWKV